MPGSNADLNAYEAVYYAGNANVGAKTIAINLPNDEEVQLKKGTRRLQLENVMQAKFDKILVPIATQLIADDQLKHVTFDAFFADTMFHEVAHGLGIKKTLDGKGTVDEALKEYASSFEEGKADILGLYMIDALSQQGELDKTKLMDNYVTFLAGILRSVRFGASDAHGKANMLRFNFFAEQRRVRARCRDRQVPRRHREDARGDEHPQREAADRPGRRRLRRGQAHDRHDGRDQARTRRRPGPAQGREDPGRHPLRAGTASAGAVAVRDATQLQLAQTPPRRRRHQQRARCPPLRATVEVGRRVRAGVSEYCDYAPGHPLHGPYHDAEYGFPHREEAVLFERLVLEINQAGLSWETMLKKRDGFRRAYDGFDVDRVAAYGDADRERLLNDAGIIRNRLKVERAR